MNGIESRPDGAVIQDGDGNILAQTPFDGFIVSTNVEVELTIGSDGYRSTRIEVDLTTDQPLRFEEELRLRSRGRAEATPEPPPEPTEQPLETDDTTETAETSTETSDDEPAPNPFGQTQEYQPPASDDNPFGVTREY